jgi:hypothetical protein
MNTTTRTKEKIDGVPLTKHIGAELSQRSPERSPHDVVADRYGHVREINESSDRLGRLDPKTGT